MANKPVLHRRDHEHGGGDVVRIVYEDVGDSGGGGGGIMFDTYPQTGTFLVAETTGAAGVSGHTSDGIVLTASGGDIDIVSTDEHVVFMTGSGGLYLEGDGDGGVELKTQGDGDLLIAAAGAGSSWLKLQVGAAAGHQLEIIGLPSAAFGSGNGVWRDAGGFLRIG